MVGPAALFTDRVCRNKKARTGNSTVHAKLCTRTIEKTRLTQEPKRISRRDPVVAKVFGIAVAGQRGILTGIKHLIHLAHKLRVNQIICVEYEKAVICCFAVVVKDMVEQIIERISLADLHLIEPLIHDSARLTGNFRRVIRAVVRNDKDIQQFLWIVLFF